MKTSVRAATFIEYAILGMISVTIGGVILSILNPGMFSGGAGNKHAVTATPTVIHHASGGMVPLGDVLRPAVIFVGGLVVLVLFIRIMFRVLMLGSTRGSSEMVPAMNEGPLPFSELAGTLDVHNEKVRTITESLQGRAEGDEATGNAGVLTEKPLVHQFVGPMKKQRRAAGQPKFR